MRNNEEYDFDQFYAAITGGRVYNSRTAKATFICNPVIRYVHRLITGGVLGRGELGAINISDLYMVWCLLRGDETVDTTGYMLQHWESHSKRKSGDIVFGGFITRIAILLGIDVSGLEGEVPPLVVNLPALVHMNHIEVSSDREPWYKWILHDGRRIDLPLDDQYSTQDEANWGLPGVGYHEGVEEVEDAREQHQASPPRDEPMETDDHAEEPA